MSTLRNQVPVTGAGYGCATGWPQRDGHPDGPVHIVLLAQVLLAAPCYDKWAGIFPAMDEDRTFATIIAMLYHAWVGVRDIWMDYVKPVACAWRCTCCHPIVAGRLRWLGIQVLWRL